jgi:thiamine-monophosphate kinase
MVEACEDRVGMIIIQDDLPIPREVFEVAAITGNDPLEMAIAYGEDFELLLTVPRDFFEDLKSRIHLYKIGFVDSSGRIKMIDKSGETNIITPRGYEHLK